MKLSKIIKALEEGKTVKTDNDYFYQPEYFKKHKIYCINNILIDIKSNRTFEIIEPNKVIEMYGRCLKSCTEWGYDEDVYTEDTHKITFEVDKDNKPICDTIKMIEL